MIKFSVRSTRNTYKTVSPICGTYLESSKFRVNLSLASHERSISSEKTGDTQPPTLRPFFLFFTPTCSTSAGSTFNSALIPVPGNDLIFSFATDVTNFPHSFTIDFVSATERTSPVMESWLDLSGSFGASL